MIGALVQFLKLIRFLNLAITALALWMHWYFLLKLPLNRSGWSVDFDATSLLYLSMAFAMVMASGFIINDIYDMDIDAINKGNKRIVGHRIKVRHAWMFFWILLFVAASISLWLAYRFDKLKFIWIYPLAAVLLVIYSAWLKKTMLAGNLLIALLCGAVLLIPLAAESSSVSNTTYFIQQTVYKNFMICFVVATLITLSREIVKDIEDVPGDEAAGARTLPIRKGIQFSKKIVMLLLVLTAGILLYLVGWGPGLLISMIGIVLGFIVPIGYILVNLYKAQHFQDFHRISTYLKLTMISGMILLPIILYYQFSWTG